MTWVHDIIVFNELCKMHKHYTNEQSTAGWVDGAVIGVM